MNSLFVLILGGLGIAIGYGVYAKSIDRRIIQPDDSKATPATMYMDGVDFTPANRNVLFGYQFKSVAALGPILGPIMAVRYGWLPALLWVILGTFFIGWVQDYASIVLGVREEGQSFGALSYRLVSPRARALLLIFIYVYLLLIMGAFGKTVGYDLLPKGGAPLGVLVAILAGLLAGQMTYRMKMDIILTTVVTVAIAFIGIFVAKQDFVVDIVADINSLVKDGTEPVFGSVTWPQFLWSLVTLIICGVGAILPIWRWAQPINYVAFWIVFAGIVGGTIGLIVWHPSIDTGDFPAFTTWNGTFESDAGALAAFGPLWPLLFVTIACGAISGWHSLVSSSGTARQLEKEGDALFVGGGSMFLEMFLAVLALLTAVVGIGGARYFEVMPAGRATVFAEGLATFLNKIGLPLDYGEPYAGVFLILMALTIMYLVVRFMRVASAEFLGDRIPLLRNVTVGTIVALVFSGLLLYTGFWDDVWVLFGGANQLMAALALLLISLWLMSQGKNYLWAFIPFIFMFITTIAALIRTSYVSIYDKAIQTEGLSATDRFGAWFAGILGVILIIAALLLAYDAVRALLRYRAEVTAEAD